MEYFVRHMEEFSGSVIVIVALLLGISIGWFLRGQTTINRVTKGDTNEPVSLANFLKTRHTKWQKVEMSVVFTYEPKQPVFLIIIYI